MTQTQSHSELGRPPTCECGECPKCKKRAYMRQWYRRKTIEERRAWVARRDRGLVQARDRDRAKHRSGVMTEVTRRWRKDNPEAAAAHTAVARALRRGELVKESCEHHGPDCRGVIHAHHDDYSKPLEVRWFCASHHGALRRTLESF